MNMNMNDRPFIRGQIAIDSMRDNGFLSAAHAIAEIIDNSVQAKANNVELITFEKVNEPIKAGSRRTKQIYEIGILDNGTGMDLETLHLALEFGASKNKEDSHGIGRFGMGLPNASISQCKRVDVWSWTNKDKILHTYLDIDMIVEGKLESIPFPKQKKLPNQIIKSLDEEEVPKSGTLILWSKIDRCQWKTGISIYKHTQDLIGRMYRKLLSNSDIIITFKSVELLNQNYKVQETKTFNANDPTYLLKNTSLEPLPGDSKGEAFFEVVREHTFKIKDENGIKHDVHIIGTVVKKSILEEIAATTNDKVGKTEWGKHVAKNIGLSIIRAGRELALEPSFYKKKLMDTTIRWTGIELSFPPALDNIFGVTNNKQHVVNLKVLNITEDSENEGFDSEEDYRSYLKAHNHPKIKIYEILMHIDEVIDKITRRTKGLKYEGTKKNDLKGQEDVNTSETNKRLNKLNKAREEGTPTNHGKLNSEDVKKTLEEKGHTPNDASILAKEIIENNLEVYVEEMPLETEAFFDVTTEKGLTLLQINTNHVFTTRILNESSYEQRETLIVCLAGWARMERESVNPKLTEQYRRARKGWGTLLDSYLGEDDDF